MPLSQAPVSDPDLNVTSDKDYPESRAIQYPESGRTVEFPEINGLHHYYERLAA